MTTRWSADQQVQDRIGGRADRPVADGDAVPDAWPTVGGGDDAGRAGGRSPVERRRRQRAWAWLVTGVVVVIGSCILFGAVFAHLNWLMEHGARVPAVVLADDQPCTDIVFPHVQVAYVPPSGTERIETLPSGATDCPSLAVGTSTWVYVNPADPADAVLGNGGDPGPVQFVPSGLMVVGLGVLGYGGVRLWITRRRRPADGFPGVRTVPHDDVPQDDVVAG